MLGNLSYNVLIFIPSSGWGDIERFELSTFLPYGRLCFLLHQCRKCTYCSKYTELFWLFRIIYCNISLTNINQTSPSISTPHADLTRSGGNRTLIIFSYNSTKLLVVGRPHLLYTRGLVMPLYHQWLTLFFTPEGSATPTINKLINSEVRLE